MILVCRECRQRPDVCDCPASIRRSPLVPIEQAIAHSISKAVDAECATLMYGTGTPATLHGILDHGHAS